MLAWMLPAVLSFGAVYALIPVIIIVILIAAAAGLNRGWSVLGVFGIAALSGMAGRGGASTGKGIASVKYQAGFTRISANKKIAPQAASMGEIAGGFGAKTAGKAVGAAKRKIAKVLKMQAPVPRTGKPLPTPTPVASGHGRSLGLGVNPYPKKAGQDLANKFDRAANWSGNKQLGMLAVAGLGAKTVFWNMYMKPGVARLMGKGKGASASIEARRLYVGLRRLSTPNLEGMQQHLNEEQAKLSAEANSGNIPEKMMREQQEELNKAQVRLRKIMNAEYWHKNKSTLPKAGVVRRMARSVNWSRQHVKLYEMRKEHRW